MKQALDFIPVLLFFIAYKFYDIYVATAVVMIATLLHVTYTWFRYRKVETMQWITLGLIIIMGGATLYLQDEQFIKWKLSIIEWLFGLAFLGSQFIGNKPFVERIMSANISLPDNVWKRLNLLWASFFMSVGFINLYVMYNFSTDEWVTFKTFGVPGLLVIFIVAQMFFLYKYIPQSEK
ncbi:MAG: septation protein A [Methylovulum sp.]|jgi:intracellular septation protein|nr:septation protein A [Methylovulum sp.]TSA39385.1 MAG: septation protein A [Methylococcaceae bacterium]